METSFARSLPSAVACISPPFLSVLTGR